MNIIILFIYIHGSKEDFKIETLMHYTQKNILIGLFRMMAEIAIIEDDKKRPSGLRVRESLPLRKYVRLIGKF